MPAAKGTKRPSVGATSPSKKAHQDPAVQQKCNLVMKGLATAPASFSLPDDVAQMLSTALPLSLGEWQEKRHPYQIQVVDTVAGYLGEIEAQLQTESQNIEAEIRDIDASKELKASAVITAQEVLAARETAMEDQKRALADATIAFRDFRNALRQANASQAEVNARIDATVAKLAAMKSASQDLVEPLKASSVPEVEADGKLQTLMSFLATEVGLDESLLTALPAALGKTTDVRGPFDVLAVQELEHVMSERVAAISREVEAGEPAKAEIVAKVNSAQASYDEAASKLTVSATAFRAAQAEQEEGTASVASAKKTVKDLSSARARVSKQHDRARDRLGRFRDGALSVFGELRDRGSPVDVDEQAAETKEGEEMQQQCQSASTGADEEKTERVDTDAVPARESEAQLSTSTA